MDKKHLVSMIRESAGRYGDCIALRIKRNGEWSETTYSEFLDKINILASALIGLDVKEGEKVAIFSANMPEWALADFAIFSVRGVTVPIFGTNSAGQAEYIIRDAGIRIVFTGDQSQYDKMKSIIQSSDTLKLIIAMTDNVNITGKDSVYLSKLLSIVNKDQYINEINARMERAASDELCSIIYTSGTTGEPKGVMLTHSNFDHQIRAIHNDFNLSSADRSLCFIPLSHVYERAWSYCVFAHGMQNNYLEDIKQILETMKEVRPTAMVSVPRLYEKIYAAVKDKLQKGSFITRLLFNWSFYIGRKYAYRKKDKRIVGPLLAIRYLVADKLVLKKMRDIVGGDKNFFSAGGAPLSKDIEEFFFAAGLLICQGYGLTETSPVITCNSTGRYKFGTVGHTVMDVEVRIDPHTGEIQVKGPNVMLGYYNKPEATREAFTEDGWLRTGDVGMIDSEGFVKITDRIKDLIITAGGKNIAPLRIESMLGIDYYIEQICTIGDRQKYVSALIVPNFAALEEYASDKGINYSSREDLVSHPEIIKVYNERIESNSGDLSPFERIKRFTLLPKAFSQETGELTPTLKIIRKAIVEKYRDIISRMYDE